VRPDIVFGADIIAGFPTEDEAMFENSLALVEDCGLTHLHVFPYSARKGTPAARMPQLKGPVIRERAKRLRDAGERRLLAHLDAQQGKRLTVLSERGGMGRAPDFTAVQLNHDPEPGLLIDITVAGHDGRRLIAR
jgi:threonylcarbamoyladenosine tRNA methylthiotransferase MtaB